VTWEQAEVEWVGAVVLVGLTYLNGDLALDRQEQFYGQVESVDRNSGIRLNLSGRRGGETYDLPPHLEAFEPAPRGQYRLRSTGDVVTDPDLICSWTISPPASA
jgi:hypothetical protein